MMSLQGLDQSLEADIMALNGEIKPICYEVTLQKRGETFVLGKVVTHLLIEDWAALHHYKLLDIGNVRLALAGERTDLI